MTKLVIFKGEGARVDGMLNRFFRMYVDGFRSMVLGRTLWTIILLKLFIMFVLLKTFFFPDFLGTKFSTDVERAEHVLQNLTQRSPR